MKRRARLWIGLGSNLGDRWAHLREAKGSIVAELGLEPHLELRVSSVYETLPIGPSSFPFLNAAIALDSHATPGDALAVLQRIECEHGRERDVRWGARTLDLDLLAYRGDPSDLLLVQKLGELELPHPRLAERDFVLAPLAELDPLLEIPGQGCVAALLERLPSDGATILRRFDRSW